MEIIKESGKILSGLILFMTIMIIVMSGCTDSAVGQQGSATPVHEKQSENPAVTTTAAITTPEVPAQKIASPVPSLVSSPGAITFDPPGEKKTGESFAITGTTSLPAGTNLFWDITPDPGKVPTGIDITVPVGIMANNQVTGTGTANTVLLSVDGESTKDLPKGKYVIIVVSLNGDPMTTDPTSGTLAGYSYVTLK